LNGESGLIALGKDADSPFVFAICLFFFIEKYITHTLPALKKGKFTDI
jgi:hypothetical protein